MTSPPPETDAPTVTVQLGGVPERLALVFHHAHGAQVVDLPEGESLVVGRDEAADLVLSEPMLSRRHARFSWRNGHIVVEDLASRNGTRLNGHPVKEPATLHPGDEVLLGAVAVTLRRLGGDVRPWELFREHDWMRVLVADAITRARYFRRPLTLVRVRAVADGARPLSLFEEAIRGVLRPVDALGWQGARAFDVLLPEMGPVEAGTVASKLLGVLPAAARPVAGVASWPENGQDVEALLESARESARLADGERPVVVMGATRTLPREEATRASALLSVSASSESMRLVKELVERAARGILPVLILGETGSGKEVVARALHELSSRRTGPLCVVNCGALPGQLIESTLFGHEKGAFTGAVSRTEGVFEAAEGGTVFLDEVGELTAQAQATLLRVLEARRITRVGSTKEIPVDVRVVAATHRDLAAMAGRGEFRWDLVFRLNSITIRVPPLRERPSEIIPLAMSFLTRAAQAAGLQVHHLSPGAQKALRRYAWPGNVRELRNAMEHAVVMARSDSIEVADLPDIVRLANPQTNPFDLRNLPATAADASATGEVHARSSSAGHDALGGADMDFSERVRAFEVGLIRQALSQAGGNQAEAARRLRMPLRTFFHKVKAYGLKR